MVEYEPSEPGSNEIAAAAESDINDEELENALEESEPPRRRQEFYPYKDEQTLEEEKLEEVP